jgi:hypothetical protein
MMESDGLLCKEKRREGLEYQSMRGRTGFAIQNSLSPEFLVPLAIQLYRLPAYRTLCNR